MEGRRYNANLRIHRIRKSRSQVLWTAGTGLGLPARTREERICKFLRRQCAPVETGSGHSVSLLNGGNQEKNNSWLRRNHHGTGHGRPLTTRQIPVHTKRKRRWQLFIKLRLIEEMGNGNWTKNSPVNFYRRQLVVARKRKAVMKLFAISAPTQHFQAAKLLSAAPAPQHL